MRAFVAAFLTAILMAGVGCTPHDGDADALTSSPGSGKTQGGALAPDAGEGAEAPRAAGALRSGRYLIGAQHYLVKVGEGGPVSSAEITGVIDTDDAACGNPATSGDHTFCLDMVHAVCLSGKDTCEGDVQLTPSTPDGTGNAALAKATFKPAADGSATVTSEKFGDLRMTFDRNADVSSISWPWDEAGAAGAAADASSASSDASSAAPEAPPGD